jgi:hypothetical protein
VFEVIPTKRGERWELMRSIIQHWMRPLTEADTVELEQLDRAEKRLACRLPPALREWYRLAGNAKDIWSCQDRLASPDGLHLRGDILVFCWENQGIWRMGVRRSDCEQDDPPVVAWMNEAWAGPVEFGQLNGTLSECALQYLAWVLKWAPRNRQASGFAEYGDIGWWSPATLAAIERGCVRCAFPVWRLWERDNVFYERPDLLVEVGHPSSEGETPILYVSGRSRDALREFEALVRGTGFRWDSGGWYS